MFSVSELQKLQKVDIKEIDRKQLTNYEQLICAEGKSREERIEHYFSNVGANPYVYEDNGFIVKNVMKQDSDLSFTDCMKQFVASKAGIR